MNNHKLTRRTLSSTTTGNNEQGEQSQYTKSELVFIGYNETTGKPMYIEPCISNDNPNPYETIPKCLNLLDGLDNEGECGSYIVRTALSMYYCCCCCCFCCYGV